LSTFNILDLISRTLYINVVLSGLLNLYNIENTNNTRGDEMLIKDYPSPNYFTNGLSVKAIVLHGSAGPLRASLATLTDPRNDKPELAVSSHYCINENGDIYRLVKWWLGHRAWANGIIERPDEEINWLMACIGTRTNPNMCTISIEHVASYQAMLNHGKMTDKQWDASTWLVKTLLQNCGLTANKQTILGHNQINSVKKPFCPGVINVPAYINALNGIY
jgi:N-acetyl-anhydromuramyl-L-alanine amidase AmpD